jgi:C4-dicarboxylate-binding protein DctP
MVGRNAFLVLCISIFASAASLSAQTVTLRIATNVPTNSPWDLGLKRMAAEFDQASMGRVKIVFPPSAHVSTEEDIIQRMKLGVDGALLSTYGLAELYPDSLALSLPGVIGSDEEFDAVLAAVGPLIKSKLSNRYLVLALSKGGWLRCFSRSPIVYPSDFSRSRISIEPTSEQVIALMQSAGAKVVTGSVSDFLLQINSNAVDSIFQSPILIATLWSQLRGKISYMSGFKVAPFLGAMVFNKASWEKIPPDLRPRLEKVVCDIAAQISVDTAKLEEDAIASLDGIKTPPAPADAAEKWADLSASWREGLIAHMFSADILDRIDAALAKARGPKVGSLPARR